jgi:hypothetical protein
MTTMREYIDVVPSNGSGTASYKDGNPIINFIIGAQNRFLLGSTIRLNGKFTRTVRCWCRCGRLLQTP